VSTATDPQPIGEGRARPASGRPTLAAVDVPHARQYAALFGGPAKVGLNVRDVASEIEGDDTVGKCANWEPIPYSTV
jgi:hypothetical protein